MVDEKIKKSEAIEKQVKQLENVAEKKAEVEAKTEVKTEVKAEARVETRGKGKRNYERKPFNEVKEPFVPKTQLGEAVLAGSIKDIDYILNKGQRVLESGIIDILIPDLKSELILVGQAKGKFGGGKRRIFKQTQKKTKDGNTVKFTTVAAVGDNNGHVGLCSGKAKETNPAKEKALRKSKLSLIKIKRGCGSWQCDCHTPHSVPFKVSGKFGSVKISILPAPKGTGLRIEGECQKLLELAGIKDCWSTIKGATSTKLNVIYACFDALKKLEEMKVKTQDVENLAIVSGQINKVQNNINEE